MELAQTGSGKAEAKPRAKKWSFDINKKWCKGCGICIEFCPKSVLCADEFGKVEVSDADKCTGCGLCEMRCPDFAIVVREAD